MKKYISVAIFVHLLVLIFYLLYNPIKSRDVIWINKPITISNKCNLLDKYNNDLQAYCVSLNHIKKSLYYFKGQDYYSKLEFKEINQIQNDLDHIDILEISDIDMWKLSINDLILDFNHLVILDDRLHNEHVI